MEIINDSAIVVAGRDLGESDRLMTFITMRYGKVRAVAKGARRSRKRFLNALEPCTSLIIRVIPPRTAGLGRLDSAEITESYPSIRASVESFMLASLCCELTNLWVREGDSHSDIFDLFQWYLHEIDTDSSGIMSTLVFKTRLLSMAGYSQVWDRCVRCGAVPRGMQVSFSMDKGGCICSSCSAGNGTVHTVAAGTLRSLAFVDTAGSAGASRLRMGKTAMNEAWHLLAGLHRYHLQQGPMSYSVLDEVIRRNLR